MARLNSFFLPPDQWPSAPGDVVSLQGDEARHMLTVLRTQADQTVRLFDGQGNSGLFRVLKAGKKQASLETISLEDAPVSGSNLTLAIGWGKSKRRNYLFEKIVELQAEGVVFWEGVRSQGRLPSEPKETWREKCIQAAKQCGNPYLPSVSVLPDGIIGLIEFSASFDHCYLAWETEAATIPLKPLDLADGRSLVVIGPEGGMDESEAMQLMDAGFKPVTLGNSTLRWETAAAYCLSLAFFAGQEMK
ncbi:RsmE family RNA methyltransferase [Pseudodesulfovibrio cashew]|uniref:Ribosomal RNA small subunit methyltransferase E n=1 Tax=Pseudodesulfovibrio cashew TaxID=2678688 RepID=A0A6I6JLU5_9BACT|nr:RsmE family RNA methyltransferase [Pseudodesulfovibrio cashew]QGY41193.1 RsmE family RNA methyltransferase [Pseudodesulfovibrio cashew]